MKHNLGKIMIEIMMKERNPCIIIVYLTSTIKLWHLFLWYSRAFCLKFSFFFWQFIIIPSFRGFLSLLFLFRRQGLVSFYSTYFTSLSRLFSIFIYVNYIFFKKDLLWFILDKKRRYWHLNHVMFIYTWRSWPL